MTNPDGIRMVTDQTTAPQMETDSIIIRLNTGTKADVRITDSISTRNGKGMGSGSGRPLPSTHLGGESTIEQRKHENVANYIHRNKDDGRKADVRKDEGAQIDQRMMGHQDDGRD